MFPSTGANNNQSSSNEHSAPNLLLKSRIESLTPLSELKNEQTDRIGKMREIKSQISNLMTRLDHESKTLLSSFSQLQPENEVDMTMHSLTALIPAIKKPSQRKEAQNQDNIEVIEEAVDVGDKENDDAALNFDQNNYLTLGDL